MTVETKPKPPDTYVIPGVPFDYSFEKPAAPRLFPKIGLRPRVGLYPTDGANPK